MKIAIVCYGHVDATLGLAKHLGQLDPEIQVDFIFLQCQSKSSSVDMGGKNFPLGFVDEADLKNAMGEEIYQFLGNRASLQAFIIRSINLSDLKNYGLLWQLKKELTRNKYDILHFVGHHPWIILLNSMFRKTAKFHTLHEPYPHAKINNYLRQKHIIATKLLLRSCRNIIVPSDNANQRLTENFDTTKHQITTVPLGVFELYQCYQKDEIQRKDNLIIYFGTISEYKGVPDLLDAMQIVLNKKPHLELIVAGAGPIAYDLSTLPPNIKVVNRFLSNEDISTLNQSASLVVCPYRTASQSGVVMTSFAFDNPVIATKVGAFSEMIQDKITGLLIEPANIRSLSDAIINLFSDPNLIRKMRSNIQLNKRDHKSSWENISNQHLNLYRKSLP